MSKILDDKVLIAVWASNARGMHERRFFNRATQAFTARWRTTESPTLGYFYDITGVAVQPYFNSFRKHKASEERAAHLRLSDPTLKYNKFTVKKLRAYKLLSFF